MFEIQIPTKTSRAFVDATSARLNLNQLFQVHIQGIEGSLNAIATVREASTPQAKANLVNLLLRAQNRIDQSQEVLHTRLTLCGKTVDDWDHLRQDIYSRTNACTDQQLPDWFTDLCHKIVELELSMAEWKRNLRELRDKLQKVLDEISDNDKTQCHPER
jgi:hypothetical protein